MSAPAGFGWQRRKNGEIVITHRNKPAAILRGRTAAKFLEGLQTGDDGDDQELMARVTGNYKRGNERHATRNPGSGGR